MNNNLKKGKKIFVVATIINVLYRVLKILIKRNDNEVLEMLLPILAISCIALYLWSTLLICRRQKVKYDVDLMPLEEVDRRVEVISKELIKTQKEVVKFNLLEEKTHIFDSKICGEYFIPEGYNKPINEETGNELFLLAQINFAQIPKIKDFPEEGLLQIFISGDDELYGLKKENGYKVVYYPTVPKDTKKGKIYNPKWTLENYLPFQTNSVYKLVGEKTTQSMQAYGENFNLFIEKNFKELLTETNKIGQKHVGYRVIQKLSFREEYIGCQCGGYPEFNKKDPRNVDSKNFEDVLLFQLRSCESIMWGNFGIGNFFISKENLKNKDFSKVLYNWDCE